MRNPTSDQPVQADGRSPIQADGRSPIQADVGFRASTQPTGVIGLTNLFGQYSRRQRLAMGFSGVTRRLG